MTRKNFFLVSKNWYLSGFSTKADRLARACCLNTNFGEQIFSRNMPFVMIPWLPPALTLIRTFLSRQQVRLPVECIRYPRVINFGRRGYGRNQSDVKMTVGGSSRRFSVSPLHFLLDISRSFCLSSYQSVWSFNMKFLLISEAIFLIH